IWVCERVGDVLWTRMVSTLTRATFAEQEAALDALMPHVQRAAIDATGMGMQLGERARERCGWKIEAVEFTQDLKERLANETKRAFEERRLRLPSDAAIRSSINAVKRYVSLTGKPRFDAVRTEAGHADEFWALALCAATAHEEPCSMRDAAEFTAGLTGELAGMRF